MSVIKCDDARSLMSESLDQRLDEPSGSALHAHLLTCAACHSRWEAMQHVSAVLEEADLAMPPPGFTASVMRRLAQAESAKVAQLLDSRPLTVAWATLGAIAILVLAMSALYTVRSPIVTASTAAPSVDVMAVALQVSDGAIHGAILLETALTVTLKVARLIPEAAIRVAVGWMMAGTLALAVTVASVLRAYRPQPEAV